MSVPQSLTGVCAVCYAEQPKYRCPRCKSQTCSLPCYKKHQQRSACNGVRDPAAFVKKSQWATANGIDHDYNYLKSVERQIERATDETKARTLPEGRQRRPIGKQPDGPLQRYLAEHNINIIRTPTGMSRSRLNRTRITGSGKAVWTIEWITESGEVYVSDDNSATCTIAELHEWARTRQAKASRSIDTSASGVGERKAKRQRVEEIKVVAEFGSSHKVDGSSAAEHSEADEADRESAIHYYLKAIARASGVIVLVPIDPQNSLTETLADRAVEEFPAIYVLSCAAHELPTQYMSEATWLSNHRAEDASEGQVAETAPVVSKPLDADQILEMLRRDVNST